MAMWTTCRVWLFLWCLLVSVPLAWADDRGWIVALDPTTKRVVEAAYGESELSHRPLTVRGVPSALLERVPKEYLLWEDGDLDGVPQRTEIREMSQAEKDAVEAPILAAQQQAQADTDAIATLDAQLEADDAAWGSLTMAKKLEVVKKRLHADVLRRRLGR